MATLDSQLANTGQLDLRGCGFTDACGLVAIACAAELAASEYGQWTYRAPLDSQVARYHARMHLGQTIEEACGAEPNKFVAVRERDQSDALSEVKRFDDYLGGRDIADLAWSRNETIAPDANQDIWLCINEACNNVLEHSEATGGYVAAQVYNRDRAKEKVVLAIGDTGVGIASTLARSLGDLSDAEAVKRAVEGGVTSVMDDPDRGHGLRDMADAVRLAGGKMIVRSYGAMVKITRMRTLASAVPRLEATLIAVQLPCRAQTAT
jgi:hypothetical protein